MQDQGLITLKDGVGLTATVRDIKDNPKKLRIEEIEAAQLVRALPDVDIAIINGNYAILGGLKVADALAVEAADSAAATTYANILVIRTGDEKRPELQALYKALCSDKIKEFMKTKYEGAVLAPLGQDRNVICKGPLPGGLFHGSTFPYCCPGILRTGKTHLPPPSDQQPDLIRGCSSWPVFSIYRQFPGPGTSGRSAPPSS